MCLRASCPSSGPIDSVTAPKLNALMPTTKNLRLFLRFLPLPPNIRTGALWILCGTTQESWYQKGKSRKVKVQIWFTGARDSEWQWHQLGHMQTCTLPWQITTPASHHSVFCRLNALPATQPTASKHLRYQHWSHASYKWVINYIYRTVNSYHLTITTTTTTITTTTTTMLIQQVSSSYTNIYWQKNRKTKVQITGKHTLKVCSSRWTGAELKALTTAMTPLKLFSSWKTIITSRMRDTTATRSSRFSVSTMHFSNQKVNCTHRTSHSYTLQWWRYVIYTDIMSWSYSTVSSTLCYCHHSFSPIYITF